MFHCCYLQVEHFTTLNKNITSSVCLAVAKGNQSQAISSSQWHPTLVITQTLCQYLNYSKAEMVKDTINYALRPDI